jgi:hypothetical protein
MILAMPFIYSVHTTKAVELDTSCHWGKDDRFEMPHWTFVGIYDFLLQMIFGILILLIATAGDFFNELGESQF